MATYNCNDSNSSAYGVSSYGTCSSQTVGAPNTGTFEQIVSSGSLTIVLPLAAAVIVVVIASLVIRHKKATRS